MKIQFCMILAVLINLGCAPSFTMRQRIMRDQVTSLDALTSSELTTFENNWKIAEEILEQDKMAWIGTDSILAKVNKSDVQKFRGYIVTGNIQSGEVSFYSFDKDSTVGIVASALFSDGKFMTVRQNFEKVDSVIIKTAICLQRAKQMNMGYIRNQKINYNSYSLYTDTTITIYLAPGSNDNYYIFCGGLKTVFDKNLHEISNVELHKSIVAYKTSQIGDLMARSSSVTDILNEIDIAQFLIWKNRIYNQMIATKKFAFFLYYIPDENRIVKRVFKQEDMK